MRRLLCFAVVLFTSAAGATTVTHPFTGVTLVRSGDQALTIVNLCAPGVAIRATKYGERKNTPQQWATRGDVQTQVAVNGDFFDFPGWTWVDGRAKGGGESWPAGHQMHGGRMYWQFGPYLAGLVPHQETAPDPHASEIVAGHNILIYGGVSRAPNFDGDGVILTEHNRTGIGLSADRKTFFLYVSASPQNGSQMVASMVALAHVGGAPPIYTATNEDGGGSSQMYVQGLGTILDTPPGRQVNNHFGVYAHGSGASPMCPMHEPRGSLDAASCQEVNGWAQDEDVPTAASAVHVYLDAVSGTRGAKVFALTANQPRGDLCKPLGSCNHAFSMTTPLALWDGKSHVFRAYALDDSTEPAVLLNTARTIKCTPTLTGRVLRHIVSGASLAAWKFSTYYDLTKVSDAALAPLAHGDDLPTSPVLWKATGGATVYLMDQGFKRHVPSSAIGARWHLDLSRVVAKTPAQVEAVPTGPDLLPYPQLLQGSATAVYLADVALPVLATDAGTVTRPDAGTVTVEDAGTFEDDDGGTETPPVVVDVGDGGVVDPDAYGSGAVNAGCAQGGHQPLAPVMALGVMLAAAWLARRR